MEATNVSPIEKDGKKLTRKFLGDTSLKCSTFYKLELKAYLKGNTRFRYGSYEDGKTPKYHTVSQTYLYI